MKKVLCSLLIALTCVCLMAQETPTRYLRITTLGKEEIKVPITQIDSIDFITEEVAIDKIDGHEYVDLGLPSGVLWATCNIGASSREEYGNHYAWGETTTKETYNWDTYQHGNSEVVVETTSNGATTSYTKLTFTKYNTQSATGDIDNKSTLDLEDDAAHLNWGGAWRMPTQAEWQELNDNCTWEWTTLHDVAGYKVTAKNGKYLFLPAAGFRDDAELNYDGKGVYYWSSTLYASSPSNASSLGFGSSRYNTGNCDGRYFGQSVRPVCSQPAE